MKHLYSILSFTIICILSSQGIMAQTSGNLIFAFLYEDPTETIENCSGEDLMKLLTEENQDWIESISCENVKIEKGVAGVQMVLNESTKYTSYIQFNFRPNPQLQATNVTFYGLDKEDEGYVKGSVSVNGTKYNEYYKDVNYFYTPVNADLKKIETSSAADILATISANKGSETTPLPARIIVNSLPAENRIQSCRIEYNSGDKANNIKIYALRVYYNNVYSDTKTAVEEIAEDSNTEVCYYDLMGRKLSSAPTNGIYIRRTDDKITKHIAH